MKGKDVFEKSNIDSNFSVGSHHFGYLLRNCRLVSRGPISLGYPNGERNGEGKGGLRRKPPSAFARIWALLPCVGLGFLPSKLPL